MNKKELTEGLAELAGVAERDHEVQMARADLYKIAKYAIKLHEMLKGVSEAEGMEGWQQSKITKAADYVGSVYHAMDYENKFEGVNEAKESPATCGCKSECGHCGGDHTMAEVGKKCGCCGNKIYERKNKPLKAGAGTTSAEVNAAASAQQSSWKSEPSFTSEGKSPHKKGSAKYKKQMAAKHANMSEGPFKGVGKQLMKRKLNKQYKKSDLANFDKSGIDTSGKTPDEIRQMKSDYYHDHMDKAARAKKAGDRLSRKNESYKEYLANRINEKLAELEETASTCPECGHAKASDNEQFDEAKQRLDPKCWKGKKIGNPKTKMKGGVRVNNCVPA